MIKRSRSGSRILAAIETIARHQPIGLSDLARYMDEDKSAVQRALATLADGGWVQAAPGKPTRWELGPHIFAVARLGYGNNDLRQRARRLLEQLRDDTGETILLNVPDVRHFVTVDVVESRHMMRSAAPVGTIVPVGGSATGRALLPFMSPERQTELIGRPPDEAWQAEFALTLDRGYAFSDTSQFADLISVAAPVFDMDGNPVAAVVVSAPMPRLPEALHFDMGEKVAETARRLSRSMPPIRSDAA